MSKRRMVIGLALIGIVIGIGGYLVSRIPLLEWIGALSLLFLLAAFVIEPDRGWYEADDLRRADKPDEHPMSDGPAPPISDGPPFQS